MGERDDAKHQVEQTRARMTAVAHEVSRRMTADYAKERARDMARDKAYELRESAVENPWLAPLFGAGVGALLGRMFISRAQERRTGWYGGRERWSRDEIPYRYDRGAYGYRPAGTFSSRGYEGERMESGDEGLGDKASELRDRVGDKASELRERVGDTASELRGTAEGAVSEAKDRAHEMKDRLGEKTAEYRERLREGAEALGSRIPDREAIRSSAREQPMLWALAAMGMGALFGFALPLSEGERRALEPAKQKFREAGSQAMDMAASRVGAQESQQDSSQTTTPSSPIEPLH